MLVLILVHYFIIKQHSGSTDENAAKATLETEQKLREIETDYNNNKDKVVKQLVESVLNVKPKVIILI